MQFYTETRYRGRPRTLYRGRIFKISGYSSYAEVMPEEMPLEFALHGEGTPISKSGCSFCGDTWERKGVANARWSIWREFTCICQHAVDWRQPRRRWLCVESNYAEITDNLIHERDVLSPEGTLAWLRGMICLDPGFGWVCKTLNMFHLNRSLSFELPYISWVHTKEDYK